MTPAVHPAAPHHLPVFITAPGESDAPTIAMALVLVAAVLDVGNLFLRLHTPAGADGAQIAEAAVEVVAVLGPLALFTHQHVFWLAGLLLAMRV